MTDTAPPARPHTTGIGTPEQIRSEKIQQQHQVVLASTEVVAAHLRAGVETLQQTRAWDGCDTTPNPVEAMPVRIAVAYFSI